MKLKTRMKRKKFFSTIGLGALGVLLAGFSPLKIFNKNKKSGEKIKVKIHPLAVKRKKVGGKNV